MGSHFIKYILEKYPDYQVVNFDKLTYAGNLENLREVENNPRYKFVQGDICDREMLEKTVQEFGIEAIVNYAAETHVDRSIMDPDAFLRTDVSGTLLSSGCALSRVLGCVPDHQIFLRDAAINTMDAYSYGRLPT